MQPHSWIVNIARGSLIDTDALVEALDDNAIGGAALDVTDPEPLPDGHPLWTCPNALITPHVANPPNTMARDLAKRVRGERPPLRQRRGVAGARQPGAGLLTVAAELDGMLKEFREFILRGNVVDLAVAVVIGAAFGAVVAAFVADIVTPLIAAIGGKPDFAGLTVHDQQVRLQVRALLQRGASRS